MISILFFVAVGLVAIYAQWNLRRHHGVFQPAGLARAIGLAGLGLYFLVEGARFFIDYDWWRSLGQAATFWQYLRIRWLPQTVMALVAAGLLLLAFQWARRRCRTAVASTRLFAWVGGLVAMGVGVFVSLNTIDPWVIALFLGSRKTGAYTDPIFHKDLAFYFFRLPFYQMVFDWVAALAVVALVIMAVTTVLGSSADRLQEWRARLEAQMEGRGYAGPATPINLQARGSLAWLVRAAAALLLVLFAVAQFLARYGLLFSSHNFLTGADFVDVKLGIPFLWLQIAGALALAVLVLTARRRELGERGGVRHFSSARRPDWLPLDAPVWLAPTVLVGFLVLAITPTLVEAVARRAYVNPNELKLESPYIVNHIQATRMAFNLAQSSHEEAFTPRSVASLDLSQDPDTTDNIRLWDEGPFQDDVTQLQALRPYYAFPHVDVDRYKLGGQTRQVLIAARSLDTNLLPQSAQSWVNLSLQYTHGYGAVAARVNAATSDGQPELLLKDAPPVGPDPDFQISRPGIYFGEDTTRPVYVDTGQDEFDYPKGDDNSYTNYAGSAGVVLSNLGMRLAAAIQQDDVNAVLSAYFTPSTRLLLHRQVLDRVQTLAPFLKLDQDPYLVIDGQGHLFWMIDAYTISDQHPYAQPVIFGGQQVNYIRNSVKITVDAYNGTVHMYVFDSQDPILRAYRDVFPSLFLPRSAMPKDLLAHIRYPRELFEAQAETDRLYHMQDPQVFYNKEDQWDIARQVVAQEQTEPTRPYYVLLKLPGDTQAEFVLMVPFTSHNRDNLIAWVAARCDPAHYGQIIFYRLPKDQLIYGPLQIESLVDQDRDISKDLSLWNQQGSRVIRATTLVLPVAGTFLYVEPIYIQAPQAKLPELKKVVLAVGNRLVYSDDLQSAIATLAQPASTGGGTVISTTAAEAAGAAATTRMAAPASTPSAATTAARLGALPRSVAEQVQNHLARYRQLTAQGQYAQAGAELQAAQDAINQALQATAPQPSATH